MASDRIEEFAKILVREVRDAAIRSADINSHPDSPNPTAKRWQKAAEGCNLQDIASVIIPDVVDNTLFYLLNAIDYNLLKLSFTSSDRSIVNLSEDGLGELGGWYMGSPGWLADYAKERFVDDFPDLTLPDDLK